MTYWYYNILGKLGFPKCITKTNFTFYVAIRKFRILELAHIIFLLVSLALDL